MARSSPGRAPRRWVLTTIAIAASGFCALFVAVAMRTPVRNASEMSASAQDSAGRFLLELFAPLRQNPGADCVVAVQGLADALTRENGFAPVHVSVCRDSTINAVSLPGRRIVVFEGLLADVTSENELTMVLAHEIGHHEANHIVEAFGRSMILTLASGGAGQIPVLGPILVQLGGLGNLRLSREAESEADALALDMLHTHYGHVGGSTGFFERRLEGEGQEAAAFEFLETHPVSRTRIEAITEQARREGWESGPVRPALPGCQDRPVP